MKVHKLKIWPEFFIEVKALRKRFEVRYNDRGFHKGDRLILEEYNPDTKEYTGDFVMAEVGYIMNGEYLGITNGFVVFSLMNITFAPDLYVEDSLVF